MSGAVEAVLWAESWPQVAPTFLREGSRNVSCGVAAAEAGVAAFRLEYSMQPDRWRLRVTQVLVDGARVVEPPPGLDRVLTNRLIKHAVIRGRLRDSREYSPAIGGWKMAVLLELADGSSHLYADSYPPVVTKYCAGVHTKRRELT